MLTILETIMEVLAALAIVGIVIYKIIDSVIYVKYKEEHKDEDI